MLTRVFLRVVLASIFFSSIAGCVESSFELASESRLPRWFDIPEELTRSDLRVTMDYYTDGNAVFKLYRKDNLLKLKEVKGTTQGDGPINLRNPPAGFPKHYPMYQVITVRDKIDVIEHRKMEPVFYVTDNPNILRELEVGQ